MWENGNGTIKIAFDVAGHGMLRKTAHSGALFGQHVK
jgi:hypothetical protein